MLCHIGMSVKPVNTSMSMTNNPFLSSSWHGITIRTKDELTSALSNACALKTAYFPSSEDGTVTSGLLNHSGCYMGSLAKAKYRNPGCKISILIKRRA